MISTYCIYTVYIMHVNTFTGTLFYWDVLSHHGVCEP